MKKMVIVLAGVAALFAISRMDLVSGGMMGGMMGGGHANAPATTQQNQTEIAEQSLPDYIHAQGLPCLQCHRVNQGVYGPAFSVTARKYENNPDAIGILSNRIANGYRRMPGNLANPEQAKVLAEKIMKLNDE